MPPSTSPPLKNKSEEQWVVVASFPGFADGEADLHLTLLKGSGIPALRRPPTNLNNLVILPAESIRILVPPDRAQDAKELLADAASDEAD